MTSIKGTGVPISDMDIKRLEEALGRPLPPDYRRFLLTYNGGRPSDTLFLIPECGEALVRVFAGIGTTVDISKWLREFGDDLPPSWIVIGFDPGGNVRLADPEGAIHYWDKALHFAASSRERNTFQIADSFDDFVKSLLPAPPPSMGRSLLKP